MALSRLLTSLLWLYFGLLWPACSQREALDFGTTSTVETGAPNAAPTPPPPPRSGAPLEATKPAARCDQVLLLTEFMPNPLRVADRFGEYLELYNPGPDTVHLNGWKLTDMGNDEDVVHAPPSLVVEPGHFIVLGQSTERERNGGVPVSYRWTDFHLSNQADRIRLENPCGEAIVDFRYPPEGRWPRARAGRAYELTDPHGKTEVRWRRARSKMSGGDWGSPGFAKWAPKGFHTPLTELQSTVPTALAEGLSP